MDSPTLEDELKEISSLLSLDDLKDVLSFAYVMLANRKQAETKGLSASQWSRIPRRNRMAFGEFAKAWLGSNGYLRKENAPSGVQPTESGQDGFESHH